MNAGKSFFQCDLHGSRVVDRYPGGCPFREPNRLEALHAMKETANRLPIEQKAVAIAHVQTCEDCVCEHSGKPPLSPLHSGETKRDQEAQLATNIDCHRPKRGRLRQRGGTVL